MLFSNATFIGIDPSGGRLPFTYAVLDKECQLTTLASGELEDVLDRLSDQSAALVAVNAPQSPNKGFVRNKLEKDGLTPGHIRGAEMRLAEYDLRSRGILVSPTASRKESCAAWMQVGFDLYHRLEGMTFKPYPSENETHQWMETHPHAAYCALMGQLPMSKPTLEGRMQRQLLLYELEMGIKDPMAFFEEITRHRLLKGVLPMECLYTSEELDAMVAAYTAFLVARQPDQVMWIGDKQEGQIALPVLDLKKTYS